jgi:heme exporter protein C
MVWARPIWNTWWTWDPRLSTAAITVLIYAAYLMLRGGIDNPDQRRRFASVYGIFAIASAILTLIIIRIEPRTIHPAVIGPSPQNAEGGFALSQSITTALMYNFVIWSVFVPATLIWWRTRLQMLLNHIELRKARIMEREA